MVGEKHNMHIIDRRLNSKSKSLGNRQRFIRRAKADIRESIKRSFNGSTPIKEIGKNQNVSIKPKAIREPTFSANNKTGNHDYIVPGNKTFNKGDRIRKPPAGGGGSGSNGSGASPDGEGQDDFIFTLTEEEFLDVFFEDLKLPDMIKTQLKKTTLTQIQRAGFSTDGSPSNLNYTRTMRKSLGRRIALRRPKLSEIELLRQQIAKAQADGDHTLAAELEQQLKQMLARRSVVGFIDPIDLQYNRFERIKKPATQAVMFMLMDVSGSMTEDLKDLAKRFFMLLHVFLTRHYRNVDLVFIRHTQNAEEVDEHTFFYDPSTGGTVVSTALEKMQQVIKDRYDPVDWNIYAAQASDGDNLNDDGQLCIEYLTAMLPIIQYFAYIEVSNNTVGYGGQYKTTLWRTYEQITDSNFAMQKVGAIDQIYPVFHKLFSATKKTT